jgi:hypothetical protein
MVLLKVVLVLVAGLLSLLAIRHVMREAEAVKVKARTRPRARQAMPRLRQDPRTGIYYPEN